MASFMLAFLLFYVGALIRISQSSNCYAQCGYDYVTATANCSHRSLDCIPNNYRNALIMDLSHNNISRLEPGDFNGTFTRLVELYLDYNNISNVTSLMNSTKMGNLEKLSVRHNVISRLDRACELGSLRDFSLDYNLLTSLRDIPSCRAFIRFSANFNKLPNPSIYLHDEFIPSVISLQYSTIRYINVYHYDSSPKFVSNFTLLLNHNDITYFYLYFFRTHINGLKLSLSYNRLQTLYTPVPTDLDISSNGLRNWGLRVNLRYSGDKFINKLDIRNNSFDSLIQPDWAEGLQILYADNNMLANVSSTTLQGFVNLTELHVANNRLLFISSTALSQLTMLRSLYLDGNALASLLGGVFLNQAELVELSITDNQLSALHPSDFMGLVSLERLYLAGNRLQYVNSEMFRQIPQVIKMDFSQNELEVFDLENCSLLTHLQNLTLANNLIRDASDILGHCDSLEILDMGFNQIQVVPGDSLAGRNRALSRLELVGNPLQCDCRLTSLRDRLHNNPPSILPRCHGPPRHSGAVVTDLDIRDFSCDPPKAVTNASHLEAVVGQTATLSCTGTGVPVPTVTWLDPRGRVIPDKWLGRFFISQGMTFHIISVRTSDQGTYTCLVQSTLGDVDRATVNLTVSARINEAVPLAASVLPTMFITLAITLVVVVSVARIRQRCRERDQTSPGATRGQHSRLSIGFRKGDKATHSDGGYVTGVDDGEYMAPDLKPGKGGECEEVAGDEYEDTTGNQPQSYEQLAAGCDDDVYEPMSAGGIA